MKKLLIALFALVCINTAFASDVTDLAIKVSGTTSQNRYFMCIGENGCFSMQDGAQGEVFPINSGDVQRIFIFDTAERRMNILPLPRTCNITVKDNQTLLVTGRLAKAANGSVHIDNLKCSTVA